MAAPVITGLAVRLIQQYPNLSKSEIVQAIRGSCSKSADRAIVGNGIADFTRAFEIGKEMSAQKTQQQQNSITNTNATTNAITTNNATNTSAITNNNATNIITTAITNANNTAPQRRGSFVEKELARRSVTSKESKNNQKS